MFVVLCVYVVIVIKQLEFLNKFLRKHMCVWSMNANQFTEKMFCQQQSMQAGQKIKQIKAWRNEYLKLDRSKKNRPEYKRCDERKEK